MKSILNALKEGRLIELSGIDKDHCLRDLAVLIEAIPDFRPGVEFVEAVEEREKTANTGMGYGWAAPHGRIPGEGEILCAIGWSPAGIDYGSPDGKPVHVVVMHYVPDSRRGDYLKEISGLARILIRERDNAELNAETELGTARIRLLDLLTADLDLALPIAKAKMIRLEAKQAAAAGGQALSAEALSAFQIVSFSVVVSPGAQPIILAQDEATVSALESIDGLSAALAASLPYRYAEHTILVRSATPYQRNRFVYECFAVKTEKIVHQGPARTQALPRLE